MFRSLCAGRSCARAAAPSATSRHRARGRRAGRSPAHGPGGPILVVVDQRRPFGHYYAEILRAEGLNEFAVADVGALSAATLSAYQVVVLAPDRRSTAGRWRRSAQLGAGRRQPDRDAAGRASSRGCSGSAATAATVRRRLHPGQHHVAVPAPASRAQTMQYHGTADRYGARRRQHRRHSATAARPRRRSARRSRCAASAQPAAQAAAFTYDLARSVVYTRQGNPAWVGPERDGHADRSDDLFFGRPRSARLGQPGQGRRSRRPTSSSACSRTSITQMNIDRTPLPRFWYLPRGDKAAVVMTGDDHAHSGTAGQFDRFKAASPPGCSVADWQCVRATSYLFPAHGPVPERRRRTRRDGFEIALHLNTGLRGFHARRRCSDNWDDSAAGVRGTRSPGSRRRGRTARTASCGATGQAKPMAELEHGVRLDTNYYYWPESWMLEPSRACSPASGFPMRFADADGSLIDVYQAATQLTDESGTGPRLDRRIDALLDRALGRDGYYGVFTANMHTDQSNAPGRRRDRRRGASAAACRSSRPRRCSTGSTAATAPRSRT